MTVFDSVNRITSGFRLPDRADHNGIDLTNPNGNWIVRELTGGTVSKIYNNKYRGLVLEVNAGGAIERYQHLKSTMVKVGDKVPQGTHIAIAGNTGECYGAARPDNENMAGRHLHFEVLRGGKIVDPTPWLGLPNKKSDYPANNTLDGASGSPPPKPPEQPPQLYMVTIGPVNEGDKKTLEEIAKKMQANVVVK